MAEDSRSNRDKILDSAEELFATQGFDGTTTREISRKAGVHLGLMAYYFGTKGELYREVIARRSPEHLADIMTSMENARKKAGDKPLTAREVIEAYWQPIIEKALRRGPGWRHYVRLLVRVSALPTESEIYSIAFPETYNVAARAFVNELRELHPEADEDAAYWASYVLNSAMNNMVFANDRLDSLSDGLCNGQDLDTILDKVAALFENGLRGLMLASSAEAGKARKAG